MALARRDAQEEGLNINFQVCDMRDLGEFFQNEFDWAVSFNALYELVDDIDIHAALRGIYAALKPGGCVAFRLRDMDFLVDDEQPRHWIRREWKIPDGRIFTMNDWEFISDDEVIAYDVFLREDETVAPGVFGRWVSETIGVVRKILRKTQFETFLQEAGFTSIEFLLPPHPWEEYKVVAGKPA
jgi:SAM-dependent methyltransferase